MDVQKDKKKCAHCGHIIKEVKSKNKYAVKAEAVWDRLQEYLKSHPGQYKKSDYLCHKFAAELWTHARKKKLAEENVLEEASCLSNQTQRSSQQEVQSQQDIPVQPNSNNSIPLEELEQSVHSEQLINSLNISQPINNQSISSEQSEFGRHSESIPVIQPEAIYSESSLSSICEPILAIRHPTQSQKRIKLQKLDTICGTQSKCSICPATGTEARGTPPDSAIDELWLTEKILITKTDRMCKAHFTEGVITDEAKAIIRSKITKGPTLSSSELTSLLLRISQVAQAPKKLSFDSLDTPDEIYKDYLGVSKEGFPIIFGWLDKKLIGSVHRSPRTALALTLAKLRLGLSQHMIGNIFGITTPIDQPIVSQTIHRVVNLLTDSFVKISMWSPDELSLSRDDVLKNHNPIYVRKLFDIPDENLVLILDGTYVYTQSPSDFKKQRQFHSSHKHRSLVKFMMVTTPDGQIIMAAGPYYASDNDASILKKMMQDNNGIRNFLKPGDVLITDRGFRDVAADLHQMGYMVYAPDHLNGRKAFTAEEANKTRKVTLVRWEVEAVNGRIKNCFRFFNNTVPNSYLCIVGDLFRLSCAILNTFHPPIFMESAKHDEILEEVTARLQIANYLGDIIKALELDRRRGWIKVASSAVPEFPRMDSEDMFRITIGVYQTKIAVGYIREQMSTDGIFTLYIRNDIPNFLRVRMRSRFKSHVVRTVFVQFDPALNGRLGVLGHYCTCPQGERTMGICAHVAAVVSFMGHYRHHPLHSSRVDVYKSMIDAKANATESANEPDWRAGDLPVHEGIDLES